MKIYNELESLGFFEWLSETHNLVDTDMKAEYLDKLPLNDIHRTVCNSMAFRWFREEYGLMGSVCEDVDRKFSLWTNKGYLLLQGKEYKEYKTYEEAELACLKKLINIVKNGK
jgi:hypothetical protein